jgi:hypothetical protein
VIGVGRPPTAAKTSEVDAPDVALSVHIEAPCAPAGRSRRACTAGLDPEGEHAYKPVAFGGAEAVRATVPREAFAPILRAP